MKKFLIKFSKGASEKLLPLASFEKTRLPTGRPVGIAPVSAILFIISRLLKSPFAGFSQLARSRNFSGGPKYLFLFLLLVPGPWSLVPGPVYARAIEGILAIVNEDVITLYDLDRAMAPLLAEGKRKGKSEEELKGLRKQVLEDLVGQRLLEQEVKKANVEVTDGDLSHAVASVLSQNQISIDMLQEELASKGISFEAYKGQLKDQIRQAKFIQQNVASRVQVSNQDVQNYRKKNETKEGLDTSARLAWIYLSFELNFNAKERRALVKKGQRLTDRARQGEEAGFGEEKTVQLKDLPREVALTIQRMEVHSISDPVATADGVYIVKLLERSSQKNPTSNLSDETIWRLLYNQRMDQEMKNYVMKLRKKAYVEIRD